MKTIIRLGFALMAVVVASPMLLAGEPSTAQKIKSALVFTTPIGHLGTNEPPESESEALMTAIKAFSTGGPRGGILALESFVTANPDSVWSPSLHVHLAERYRNFGRCTLALEHWEAAWNATKDRSDDQSRGVASRAVAGWTRLLGSLGRKEKQAELFSEVKRRGLDRSSDFMHLRATMEAHETMKVSPGTAYRCGTFALGHVARLLQPENNSWTNIVGKPSPDGGFQMSTLVEIAAANGYAAVAVNRGQSAEIIIPSVVHWKLDHYAAILKQHGDSYLVMDPTFGEDKWLAKETINAEASGNFLIFSPKLPDGWQELTQAQAALVRGKGASPDVDDEEDDNDDDDDCPPPPPPQAGDGPGAGDGDGGCPPSDDQGMPRWRVSEPYIALWLHDTPLFYKMSSGKPFQLKLSYKHSAVSKGANVPGFGDRWECNWLGMAEENPNGSQLVSIDVFHGGGGRTKQPASGALDYKRARSAQTFPNTYGDWTSGTANSYSGGAEALRLDSPLGRSSKYGQVLLYDGGTRRFFRTNRTDQYNRAVSFNYSSNYINSAPVMRMTTVTDADGKNTTLDYTNTSFPNLITSVTDPYSRVARFFYDHLGRLTNITDMAGMASSFKYDTTTSVITNLHTPYGDTGFRYFSGTSTRHTRWYRALEVSEPTGQKQLYAYFDLALESYRNSYHWNRQQYAALTSEGKTNISEMPDGDFDKASIKTWAHDSVVTFQSNVGGFLTHQAGPKDILGSRVNSVYYSYPGQPTSWARGTLKKPKSILWNNGADRLDIPRNDWGRPLQFIYWRNGSPSAYTNEFDADGRKLLKVWGPHGEQLRGYGYDATLTNLLTSVTNVDGEVLRYKHDAAARVTSITNWNGLATTNIYNSSGTYAGFLQSTVDFGYRTNSYSYLNGNVLCHTNELGLIITNTWDDLNRLVCITYQDGTTISNRYDSTKKLDLIATKDRLNNWTYFGYNDLRQLTAETNANGQVTLYDYCNCGLPSQITKLNGGSPVITTFAYDLAGRRTNVTYADGYFMNYFYDSAWPNGSSSMRIQDSSGLVVHVQNTNFNQLASIGLSQDPAGNPSGYLSQRTFDEYGRLATATDRNGVTITNAYDFLGRLTNHATLDIYGYVSNTVSYVYTTRGLTNSTDELGHKTWFVYDTSGRLLSQTNANNEVLQFSYNPADQMLTLKDGKNQQTSWNYDEYGRVTNKLDATSAVIFKYKYDQDNRLTNRWTAAKGDTFYSYDAIGNLTNVDYSGTIMDIVMKYDGLNRLTNVVDAVGTTKFGYNDAGQLTSEDGPWADDTVSYSFSAHRRSALSVSQPNASAWTQGYGYDIYNRLSNIVSAAGNFIYGYWSGGSYSLSDRVQTLGLSGQNYYNERSYIYNQFDQLARLSDTALYGVGGNLRNQHTYAMNEANQRTKQTFTGGNFTDYTYDDIGQLKTAKGKESGGSTSRLNEQFGYAYDAAWNLNYRTNNALTQTFSVDSKNQLTTAARSGTLTVAGQASQPGANLTSVTVSGTGLTTGSAAVYADGSWAKAGAAPATSGNSTYTATAVDTASRTASDSVTLSLPTSVTYSYDGNGNLTNDGRRSFEYDYENQLTNVYVASAWRSEFRYDAFGRKRIQRDYGWQSSAWQLTNEVRYVYDGMLVVQERDANNIALVSYTRGNDLSGSLQGAGGIGGFLARTENVKLLTLGSALNAHAYYHADGNGNITAMVNTNGIVVARYNYDPYGNLLGMSGPLAEANTYRFSSKEWNGNAGLYYYGFRFYEPNVQRWLNRDPIQEEGGVNLFGFCGNDTIDFVDSFGNGYGNPVCGPRGPVGPSTGTPETIGSTTPPSNIPGGPWKWSPDPNNSRGGNWTGPKPPGAKSPPSLTENKKVDAPWKKNPGDGGKPTYYDKNGNPADWKDGHSNWKKPPTPPAPPAPPAPPTIPWYFRIPIPIPLFIPIWEDPDYCKNNLA